MQVLEQYRLGFDGEKKTWALHCKQKTNCRDIASSVLRVIYTHPIIRCCMADTKLTSLAEISVPSLDDVTYAIDISDTTDDAAGSSRSLTFQRLLGLAGTLPGGRLTTETGVSVSTSDRTSQSTLYYTPHASDYVRLYDGTRIREYAFTERSLSLSSLTSGKNYDVWLYDNSGTLTLDLTAWTSDTARATAIAWQTGLGWTKSGDATRLLVGTIRTTGTTTTEDSQGSVTAGNAKRFVWNVYNRVPRQFSVGDGTSSWTYSSTSMRQMRANSANRLGFVFGLTSGVSATFVQRAANAGTLAAIYLDGALVNLTVPRNNTNDDSVTVAYSGQIAAGYHYLDPYESAVSGTPTFYEQCLMQGWVMA